MAQFGLTYKWMSRRGGFIYHNVQVEETTTFAQIQRIIEEQRDGKRNDNPFIFCHVEHNGVVLNENDTPKSAGIPHGSVINCYTQDMLRERLSK